MDTQACTHVLIYNDKKVLGICIRIDRKLRDAFMEACRVQDVPAPEVLREFIRSFIENELRRQLTFAAPTQTKQLTEQ